MKTLCIVNSKGGSGKTVTALSLAACLGERDKRVLLIDGDPQGSLSKWLRLEADGTDFYGALLDGVEPGSLIRDTNVNNVYVVPSGSGLAKAERELASEVGGELALRRFVGRLPLFDYVLLDTPPSLGILLVNALAAADQAIIPVEPSALCLATVRITIEVIDKVREVLNPGLVLRGFLPCRIRARTIIAQEAIANLRTAYPGQVFSVCIPETVKVSEAPISGKPITEYAAGHAVSLAYRRFAEQIEGGHDA